MATTTTESGSAATQADRFGPRVALPRRRRSPPGAVLGGLLVVILALVFGVWGLSLNHRTQVIVIAKRVPSGSVITAGDLSAVGIAASNKVSGIPTSEASQVVGKTAAETLDPGMLLVRSQIASGPVVGPGHSIVGLDLAAGSYPALLQTGNTVTVLSTPKQAPAGAAAPTGGGVLAANVTVYSVGESSDGSELVSVVVPSQSALPVAQAAAQGSVSLVLERNGGG